MAEPQELDGDLVKGKGIARSPGSRMLNILSFIDEILHKRVRQRIGHILAWLFHKSVICLRHDISRLFT